MPGTAAYLYCVIRNPRRPSLARIPGGIPGGDAPAIVPLGSSLWLAVSQVPLDVYGPGKLEPALRDLEWVSSIAVAHEAMVEHFARGRGNTVVPMKLFTMFSNVDRALEETRGRRTELLSVLERVAGCDEWGVRITRRPVHVTATSVGVRRISSGAAFLAAKKAVRDQSQEATRLAVQTAEDSFAVLAAAARDARRRDHTPQSAGTPPLLDAAFLVPARNRPRFHSAAEQQARACAKAGAEMTLTGPWPAYNFVQLPEQGR